MRVLALALLLGGASSGQIAVPWNPIPTEIVRFRDAAAPLESWLGKRLAIFDQTLQDYPEFSWIITCPSPRDPSEAIITTKAIYISLAQLRGFASASALADFLSHAAAHNKLGHPIWSYSSIRILSPHIPDIYVEQIDGKRCLGLEAQLESLTLEFRATSNCTPQSCAAFERLLAAAKQ